jgi:hypothetical protein
MWSIHTKWALLQTPFNIRNKRFTGYVEQRAVKQIYHLKNGE